MRVARRPGGGVTQLRFQRFHRVLHGQAPSTNARPAKPAISVINIAPIAGSSAAASARAGGVHPATSQWPSPIFSSREVIAQIHPDSRLWGILMAAGGAELMTAYGEISWPPLGRTWLIGKFGEGLPVKLDRE